MIRERARHGLAHPPRRVGRKLPAAPIFKFVDSFHQADVAFLNQIEELHTAVHVFLRDRDHEPQIGLDHLALRLPHFRLCRHHLPVDFLQLLQRQYRVHFDIDQLLLLGLNRRQTAFERGAKLARCRRRLCGPAEIGLVRWKRLDEFLARHPTPIDGNLQNAPLDRAHLRNLLLHIGAQPVDGSRREANRREFALDLLAHACEGRCGLILGQAGARHLVEQFTHSRENREAVARQLFQARFVRLVRIRRLEIAVVIGVRVVAVGGVRVDVL